MRIISEVFWNVPGGSDGPQIDEMVGYHGSLMYVPRIVALEKIAGSASARKPVITQVCAPRQAISRTGEPVFSIARGGVALGALAGLVGADLVALGAVRIERRAIADGPQSPLWLSS